MDRPVPPSQPLDSWTAPVGRGNTRDHRGPVDRGQRRDEGMATAEYAVATVAACTFAGLLVLIMRSDEVRALLTGIIQRALSIG